MDKIIIKSRKKSVYRLSVVILAKMAEKGTHSSIETWKKQAKIIKINFARTLEKQRFRETKEMLKTKPTQT